MVTKAAVKAHWEAEPCGTRAVPAEDRRAFFAEIERRHAAAEPYLPGWARFERGRGQRLLEIGVGVGTDFAAWVRAGAIATGIDLTEAGVALTRERLQLEGLTARVEQGDAESLAFPDASFDLVYCYGVLHHTPDTPQAIAEVLRVLRPGGTALLMLYHYPSWTALWIWARQCLARMRPWHSPRWAVAQYLESPGTTAYTVREARRLLRGFSSATLRIELMEGDTLSMPPGAKYAGAVDRLLIAAARRVVGPLIRRCGRRFGHALLIEARK